MNRMPSATLTAPVPLLGKDRAGAPAADPLAAFQALTKGQPAPGWLARPVLAGWGLPPERTSITLIAVSENATFRVSVDGVPVQVLRVHRPGYVEDPSDIAAELGWVQALSTETAIPVPAVIPLADGSTVLRFWDGDAWWFAVSFAFVAGTVLEDLDDPTPYYRRIGALTARMHEHSRGFQLPDGHSRFSWDLSDMLGRDCRWGDWRHAVRSDAELRLLERAEASALAAVADAPRGAEHWGLIHADLRPSNIMIDGDELTVIDFDDCGFGWYGYDFASALSFIEHRDYAPRLARDWVAGYREHAEADDGWLERACALSMLRRLTMLGWTVTHRADALPGTLFSEQLPGSLAVAERYLASPSWLLE
ncbi:phosphotransferase enzyme family protein [Mycetocola reblochoni]|uniref:Homoserine kinase n=2 Tax=Mycetocola reblochoni TaxID=331618 RepID=A0A1R4JXT0_9MICO|nr:phosphotransferase [Mycetocola reblochoni]RLP70589.1 phosphotransferase [Mycetocola reblochoni]SJN36799.1 Homoserine kinase [Mycetocola reblochoni REB411]